MQGSRRALFGFTLSAALWLHTRTFEPTTEPPLAHAEGVEPARTFDPDLVRPKPDSLREKALLARARGDLEAARALALDGVIANAEDAPLLRFMAAQLSRDLGMPATAAELMTPLAESDHPLAPWAALNVADWLEGSDPARGLTLVERLIAGTSELESFPGLDAAQRIRGRLLAQLGRRDEAIEQLERVLDKSPDEAVAIQVVLPLADLLADRSDDASLVRALNLYRRVAHRVPSSRAGRRAEQSAEKLLRRLPQALRDTERLASPEDQLARADALLSELKLAEAERAYTVVLERSELTPELACHARFGRAKSLLDRRQRAEGAAQMAQMADECSFDVDERAWARYHAARAFSAIAKNDLAVAQYDALQAEAPEHRLADDALFRSAKVLRDMGDAAGSRARLEALPSRYPHGDMQRRARFALAWQSYAEGDLEKAAEQLAGTELEAEDAEDLHGRAPYWRARFLAELGRDSEAKDAFARLFLEAPLSYYGQQAFARLSALDRTRADKLAQELSVAQATPLLFAADASLERPGFQRALALLQVGEIALGISELKALGSLSPGAEPEQHWLSVALIDRAGAHHLSVELARKRVFDLLRRAPKGRDLAFYRLAYPQAFAPLIEQASDKERVPSAFVRAVAREESAFNPRAVSRAQAYGLIQLIEPTARAIARGLDLPYDPDALRKPEINLALGVHFIGTLASDLRGQFALVPAAYNAGPSATQRWLNERRDEPLDVWIENVPYDETRHYTRRVLQSYGIYAWLDSGKLLSLPAAL